MMNKELSFNIAACIGTIVSLIGVLVLDLYLPLGIAGGVMYVIPVLISYWCNNSMFTWGVFLLASLLIVAGIQFSPAGGETYKVIFNRSLSVIVILSSSWMIVRNIIKKKELLQSKIKLDKLVVALNESQEQYLTVVENSSDLISIIKSDGFITFATPNTQKYFGFEVKELIGHNITSIIHPGDIEIIEKLLNSKNENEVFEYRINGGMNTFINVESVVNRVVQDGDVKLIINTRDITERKIAQDKIIKSESRLNEAQQIAKIGNWSLDLANNRLDWSDEVYRIFGLEPNQFEPNYEAFIGAIHPDDRELVNKAYQNSLIDKTPYEILHRLQMEDGKTKYVIEKCSSVFNDKGEAIISIGTIQDVTDLQIATNKLNKSLSEKELLLKEVHHRVKNNLQIVSGLLEMQSYRSSNDVVKKELEESRSRIKSIALMHEQLYQSNDLESVDLNNYVRILFDDIYSTFSFSERLINLDVEVENISIDVNMAVPVGLVLNELVTNSVKHAFSEGSSTNNIFVKAVAVEGDIVINIGDNGVGFNNDQRLEKNSLGTKMIKALINQLNGSCSVVSGSEGTNYKLNIPLNG